MLKALYLQASALPDDKLLVVRYEINKDTFGKIALSNCVNLFNKKQQDNLKKHLKFIEDYAKEVYFINRTN